MPTEWLSTHICETYLKHISQRIHTDGFDDYFLVSQLQLFINNVYLNQLLWLQKQLNINIVQFCFVVDVIRFIFVINMFAFLYFRKIADNDESG